MPKNKQLTVSEIFNSIQGEGSTQGKPSVFLRLTACNLLCGNPQLRDLQGSSQQEIEESQGEDAEWTCDTIATWLKGDKWFTGDLAQHLYEAHAKDFLQDHQLVITGGEPLLQQDQFPRLIEELQDHLMKRIRMEIETNGTILPTVDNLTNQYNVSPKLANSGMPKKRRIKPQALGHFSNLANGDRAIFKFVVTRQGDMQEIIDSFIQPFAIPAGKVWLMPGCSDQDQFAETAPLVAKMCKDYGFHFSSRLQINLWNETTGV